MLTISVVTAVHPPSFKYLSQAYSSLSMQPLPDGWRLQWLVQVDGDEDDALAAHELLPVDADPRISFGHSRKSGPAITRTIALSRAEGSLIKVLDADDVLAEGALHRDILAMELNRDIGWCGSRVLDFTDETVTEHFDSNPAPGRIKSGTVYAHWRQLARTGPIADVHAQSMLIHPATLCVRRSLLIALGGWMALPASEDTALLLALDAVTEGWFNSECGLYYRKWPGQVSAAAAHMDSSELLARRALIEYRVDALIELLHL